MQNIMIDSKPCYLVLTNNAIRNIESLFKDHFSGLTSEDILKRILLSEETFLVHIERDRGYDDQETSMNLFFDMDLYKEWSFKDQKQTLKLNAVLKEDCLLLTSVNLASSYLGTPNNRRISTYLHFFFESSPVPFPRDILEKINELPVSIERSRILNHRLQSWEIYLDLMKKNAENNEASLNYKSMYFSKKLNYLILKCSQLDYFIRQAGLERNLRNAYVFLLDDDGVEAEKIGQVNRFIYDKNEIEVELDEDYEEYVRQNKWSPPEQGTIRLNNFGDIAQVNALKRGFNQLKNGEAMNPNLEYILFDEEPLRETTSNGVDFAFQEAIQTNLNDFQRQAVQGALAAEDLYLIQGPPGTGKTTVIAEICYQNAERGLKTLVASQSNLAVDNALSKLLAHPKIRILRKGRTESIEEEGKRFIEENIARTWKQQTEINVKDDLDKLNQEIDSTLDKINNYKSDIKNNQLKIQTYEESKTKIDEIKQLEVHKNDLESQIKHLQEQKKDMEKEITDNEQESSRYQQQIKELNTAVTKGTLLKEWQVKEDKLERDKETGKEYIKNYYLIDGYNSMRKSRITKEVNLKSLEKQHEKLKNISLQVYRREYLSLLAYLRNQRLSLPQDLINIESKISQLNKLLENNNAKQALIVRELPRKKDLLSKFNSLLIEQENILKDNHYNIRPSMTSVTTYRGTYDDISWEYNTMVSQMRNRSKPERLLNNLLKVFDVKSLLVKQTLSNHEKTLNIRNYLQHDIAFLEEEVKNFNRRASNNTSMDPIDSLIKDYKQLLADYLQKEMNDTKNRILKLKREINKIKSDMDSLSLHYDSIIEHQPRASLSELKASLRNTEKEQKLLGSAENYINRTNSLIQNYHHQIKLNQAEIESLKESYQENASLIDSIHSNFEEINLQYNLMTEAFPDLVGVNVDQDIQTLNKVNSTLEQQIQLFKQTIEEKLPQKSIQEEWLTLLNNAKEHDLNEVKKLYIKHANVIGITCVQSARRDFAEEYPNFDVVIIDEVSKANPAELLLPMLKGKKIILVGDQHQLPPMIGLDSLEEFIEAREDTYDIKEIEEILQESLFERLFKAVDDDNKASLRIQYRMHEDIMNNITQFYIEDNNSVGLVCGLNDSNSQRDHQLNGQYIQRGQHVMWFDTPHEKDFFEQQYLGSTSLYNEKEIEIIAKLLIDINEATAQAKAEGRLPMDINKQVGLISFYGEQVKKLKDLVETMELTHIDYRIGTVDRFQGMEKEIVIASFVRNHKNPRNDIGFSNNYRRLNVALSRAQELLIIVGSAKMFTERAKSKTIYSRVVENIRALNGMRDYMGRVK